MAIQTTPKLETKPDVRIFFSGLMILEPSAQNKSCEVYVHRAAPNHVLTIEVREKHKNKPDLIKMRHVGPLPYALPPLGAPPGAPSIHGMSITVDKNSKGIRAYKPGQPSSEGEALDLAINITGTDFHRGQAGQVDQLNGRPSIVLNDAVLYTADKTSPDLTLHLKKQDGTFRSLDPFASLIGGNIYLEDDASVIVRWQAQGLLEELKLKKPPRGVNYEIYIVNDPLYENNTLAIPQHDEFKEYYKLLPVKSQDQFRLEVVTEGPQAPPPDRGSTKTPCMSVLKDGD